LFKNGGVRKPRLSNRHKITQAFKSGQGKVLNPNPEIGIDRRFLTGFNPGFKSPKLFSPVRWGS